MISLFWESRPNSRKSWSLPTRIICSSQFKAPEARTKRKTRKTDRSVYLLCFSLPLKWTSIALFFTYQSFMPYSSPINHSNQINPIPYHLDTKHHISITRHSSPEALKPTVVVQDCCFCSYSLPLALLYWYWDRFWANCLSALAP